MRDGVPISSVLVIGVKVRQMTEPGETPWFLLPKKTKMMLNKRRKEWDLRGRFQPTVCLESRVKRRQKKKPLTFTPAPPSTISEVSTLF